jgi:hypothetical protein
MNSLFLYLFAAFATAVLVVGVELRRSSRVKRLLLAKQACLALEQEQNQRQELSQLHEANHQARNCTLSWFHIAQFIKQGDWIEVRGELETNLPFCLLLEPQAPQELIVRSYQIGDSEPCVDLGQEGLMRLYPGMHATFNRDESRRLLLVAGSSKIILKRDFAHHAEALLAIENHNPRRQAPELRCFYRSQRLSIECCSAPPSAPSMEADPLANASTVA